AAVVGAPDAAAGDAEDHRAAVARVDEDAVDAGVVVAAAEPFAPFAAVPQVFDQPPARAAVVGAEEAAGDGAGPDSAGLVCPAGGEAPDQLEVPGRGVVAAIGLGRVRGCGELLPGGACVVAAMQLAAEVAEVEGGVDRAVARIDEHLAHRIAEEVGAPGLPAAGAPAPLQQALAGCDPEGVGHGFSS